MSNEKPDVLYQPVDYWCAVELRILAGMLHGAPPPTRDITGRLPAPPVFRFHDMPRGPKRG